MPNPRSSRHESQSLSPRTLCSPAEGLTCFRCCPPIRPAAYDHLDFVGILRREFAENRRIFLTDGPRYRPIVGYCCWALGFLDNKGREVGCLLHPCRNEGRDLRHLVNYGNKCKRESCLPAKMFSILSPEGQEFWLPLASGLSVFHYSSPRSNPLFHLLLWGPHLLESLRLYAEKNNWSSTELIERQCFLFSRAWDPLSHQYLFHLALDHVGIEKGGGWPLEAFCRRLWGRLQSVPELIPVEPDSTPGIFTHLLPVGSEVANFIRLALGWKRISWMKFLEIEGIIIQTTLAAASI